MPPLQPTQLQRLDEWLRSILWEGQVPGHSGSLDGSLEIHRLKARLVFQDGEVKMVQGVREVFEIVDVSEKAMPNEQGNLSPGKVVLIGRGVKAIDWDASLQKALANA